MSTTPADQPKTMATDRETFECGACRADVYLEPHMGWVDVLAREDGGTYRHCPLRRSLDHWPVERTHSPASVPTLNAGDVVHELGMRVLIDRKPTTYVDGDGYRVYSFRGRVTNLEDLSPSLAMYVPDGRWTVHGNYRATVQVQRRVASDF